MLDIFYLEKGLKRGKAADIARLKSKPVWIDCTDITKEDSEILKRAFGLHPLTVEDMENNHVRIKIEEFSDYLFCVFYGIRKEKAVELTELDLIIGKNFIISNHRKQVASFEELKKNEDRLAELLSRGIDSLFHRLLDLEVDNYFPILEFLDDEIEKVEEEVTRRPRPELLGRILGIKRMLLSVKKVAFQQREKAGYLAKNSYPFISKRALPYFRDLYDNAIRVSDAVENQREAVGGAFDIYMMSLSNNMNEVMKVLSIMATIALPLTVISGIYGTNFSNLPGSENAFGFWVMISAMAMVSLSMLTYFKRKKWF